MNALNPFAQFDAWFREARAAIPVDPNAMTLATVGHGGRPSARIVLLKDFSDQGFVFYTNFKSQKGRELAENPVAALCFHWRPLERQVRVEGAVERVSDAEADAYYASRARGSQLGAWASHQSEVLDRRETLEARVEELEKRFQGQDIPRPPFWGGFLVVPDRIEFWTSRESRLHDRQVFLRDPSGWRTETLNP